MSDTDASHSWLKRQAEIVASIGAILGGLAAFIAVFGGSFPPWYTPAKAAEDQRTNAKIQEQTVQVLGKVTDKLDALQHRLDLNDCSTLAARLEQAQAALRRNPADSIAAMLRDGTQLQMRQIQGCV